MNKSDSIGALATALALAQAEIDGAEKRKNNPAFKSRYADLGAVWEACQEPLTKHGLSVVQIPEESEDPRTLLRLTTVLLHKSGEWISSTTSIPITKPDAHGFGSALTYARRYTLAAMLSVCSDEDDDGNAATGRNPHQVQQQRQEQRQQAAQTQHQRPAEAPRSPAPSQPQPQPQRAQEGSGAPPACVTCQKAITRQQADATRHLGRLYCKDHVPAQASAEPPSSLLPGGQWDAPTSTRPGHAH